MLDNVRFIACKESSKKPEIYYGFRSNFFVYLSSFKWLKMRKNTQDAQIYLKFFVTKL